MKSCRTRGRSAAAGYTLMEILIAMGLLVMLGGGLVTLLREGIGIWEVAEKRGRVYEEARALLDLVTEDLRSTLARAPGDGDDTWVRFLADRYSPGKEREEKAGERPVQRLRFVRSISGEMADPVLRQGGKRIAARTPLYYDGRPLDEEARSGLLRAPAGRLEVFWMPDPRGEEGLIWRGVRAPPGGPQSLFVDANVEDRPAGIGGSSKQKKLAPAKADGAEKPGATEAAEVAAQQTAEPYFLERFAVPVARDVLHFGFRFWTSTTNTWREVPTLSSVRDGQLSGPSFFWDSTRALLSSSSARSSRTKSKTVVWSRRAGSLEDARDDVFPELVEVTVVIGEPPELFGPRLAAEVSDKSTTIQLTREIRLPDGDDQKFVRIGSEWIAIAGMSGRTLTVRDGGRGARGTSATSHKRSEAVRTGTTFRRIVSVPCHRRAVKRVESGRRSLRGRPR